MASRSRSGSRSFKSSSSKAMKFFSGNSLLTNLAIFITIAVSISYLAKQHFYALIMLYGVAAIIFLISKNVLMSLALAIILTNLFAPPPVKRVKFFREGNQNMGKKQEHINKLKEIKGHINSSDDLPQNKKNVMVPKITTIINLLEDENKTLSQIRDGLLSDIDELLGLYPSNPPPDGASPDGRVKLQELRNNIAAQENFVGMFEGNTNMNKTSQKTPSTPSPPTLPPP